VNSLAEVIRVRKAQRKMSDEESFSPRHKKSLTPCQVIEEENSHFNDDKSDFSNNIKALGR
jgi:hypothetical protein